MRGVWCVVHGVHLVASFLPSCTSRHGTARHGTARHGTARHGAARHGTSALHCALLLVAVLNAAPLPAPVPVPVPVPVPAAPLLQCRLRLPCVYSTCTVQSSKHEHERTEHSFTPECGRTDGSGRGETPCMHRLFSEVRRTRDRDQAARHRRLARRDASSPPPPEHGPLLV